MSGDFYASNGLFLANRDSSKPVCLPTSTPPSSSDPPARKKRRKAASTSSNKDAVTSNTTLEDSPVSKPVAKKRILGVNDPELQDSPFSLAAMAKAARRERGAVSPVVTSVKRARSALAEVQNELDFGLDEDDDLSGMEESGYAAMAEAARQNRWKAQDTLRAKRPTQQHDPLAATKLDKGKGRSIESPEKESICPVCSKSFPLSQIEAHTDAELEAQSQAARPSPSVGISPFFAPRSAKKPTAPLPLGKHNTARKPAANSKASTSTSKASGRQLMLQPAPKKQTTVIDLDDSEDDRPADAYETEEEGGDYSDEDFGVGINKLNAADRAAFLRAAGMIDDQDEQAKDKLNEDWSSMLTQEKAPKRTGKPRGKTWGNRGTWRGGRGRGRGGARRGGRGK